MERLCAILLSAALGFPPPSLAAAAPIPRFPSPSRPLNAAAPASGGFQRAPGAPSVLDFGLDAPRIASLYGEASARLIEALDAVAARPRSRRSLAKRVLTTAARPGHARGSLRESTRLRQDGRSEGPCRGKKEAPR